MSLLWAWGVRGGCEGRVSAEAGHLAQRPLFWDGAMQSLGNSYRTPGRPAGERPSNSRGAEPRWVRATTWRFQQAPGRWKWKQQKTLLESYSSELFPRTPFAASVSTAHHLMHLTHSYLRGASLSEINFLCSGLHLTASRQTGHSPQFFPLLYKHGLF